MKKLLVVILGISLILALAACGKKEEAAPEGSSAQAAKEVTIKASNFQFDNAEYHVKKGEPVKLTLENTQGVHGAQIGDFKVNLDNSKKSVVFTPDKAGSFPIICSVMCGAGHANMKATLVVEE